MALKVFAPRPSTSYLHGRKNCSRVRSVTKGIEIRSVTALSGLGIRLELAGIWCSEYAPVATKMGVRIVRMVIAEYEL